MNHDSRPYEIQTQKDYDFAKNSLTRQSLPHVMLRALMRAMESYRANRKYGWSRSWNKKDLCNFQSFRLKFPKDDSLRRVACQLLDARARELSEESRQFIESFMTDAHLMGFVFVHEFTDGQRFFEGATLSFGRVKDKRYRDRLDIIVESEIIGGRSLGHGRTRIYIDPFRGAQQAELQQLVHEQDITPIESDLFATLCDCSWQWPHQDGRAWEHWTSQYIDYFGSRNFPLISSYFFTENPACKRSSLQSTTQTAESVIT